MTDPKHTRKQKAELQVRNRMRFLNEYALTGPVGPLAGGVLNLLDALWLLDPAAVAGEMARREAERVRIKAGICLFCDESAAPDNQCCAKHAHDAEDEQSEETQ